MTGKQKAKTEFTLSALRPEFMKHRNLGVSLLGATEMKKNPCKLLNTRIISFQAVK